jgi:hypothetical protein
MAPSRLKYTKQGIAALKQGLLTESFDGNKRISWTHESRSARLMIKHSRPLLDGEARHQCIESLFIETAEGERFRLPFRKLSGGRAMLEHVRQGGKPYDFRGQHITEMVEQINLLSHFRRASQNRIFEGQAQEYIKLAENHFYDLRKNIKSIGNSRGYQRYFESWKPEDITQTEMVVEDIKNLFVEQTIDQRIINALPILQKIKPSLKEADEFEDWANNIVSPMDKDTKGEQFELQKLLTEPLEAGPEGINAIESLYDLVKDDELNTIIRNYANENGAESNVWESPEVMNRFVELGILQTSDQSTEDESQPQVDLDQNQQSDRVDEIAQFLPALAAGAGALARGIGSIARAAPATLGGAGRALSALGSGNAADSAGDEDEDEQTRRRQEQAARQLAQKMAGAEIARARAVNQGLTEELQRIKHLAKLI